MRPLRFEHARPWFQRWDHLRDRRYAAIGVWIVMAAMALLLYQDSGGPGHYTAFSTSRAHEVAPIEMGRIKTIHVGMGQRVRAGEPLVTLDASDLQAELIVLEAAIAKQRVSVSQTEANADAESLQLRSDLERQLADDRAELHATRARRRAQRAELRSVGRELREQRALLRDGLVSRAALSELKMRRQSLKQGLQADARLSTLLKRRMESASHRLRDFARVGVPRHKEISRHELRMLEAQRARLLQRLRDYTLHAPVDGAVGMVHRQAGAVARPGEPIMTLQAAASDLVSVCIPEVSAARVARSDRIGLRGMDGTLEPRQGVVQALSPAIGPLPARCGSLPNQPLYGRLAEVKLDAPIEGSVSGLRLTAHHLGPTATPPSQSERVAVAEPRALEVPAALRAVSRFEPSGLSWLPELERYVVVSDDTDLEGKGRPWLYTMSAKGELDANPVEIRGIRKIKDLESIAYDADSGHLYVLASQSRSAKGKRGKARQWFLQMRYRDGAFEVVRRVRLGKLLDEAAPEVLERLGVHDLNALDIEGLASKEGALYLGLKAPLVDGQASIWRLESPENFFAAPTVAQLEPWGRVDLPLPSPDGPVDGGIAELMFAPGGQLWIAATPAYPGEEATGVLWQVEHPEGGWLAAQAVRAFLDLKPEALSINPQRSGVALVFDRGGKTPYWLEVPWSGVGDIR